jgi:hypothetical protein
MPAEPARRHRVATGRRVAVVTVAAVVALAGLVGAPAAHAAQTTQATQVAPVAPTAAAEMSAPGLGSERSGLADALPVPSQDPATSNGKADDILSRREFQEAEPGLYDRVTGWIGDTIGSLIERLFSGGSGTAVAWAILAGAVGAIVLLAVRFGRTVQRDPGAPVAPVAVEVRRSPVEWHREAEAFEARGEWKEALRCRYRALVADLVARQVVRDLAGHTAGEYRADVSGVLPEAAAEFAGASELFERAWYGDRPTGPDENARFRELAAAVVAVAAGHRGAAAAPRVPALSGASASTHDGGSE